MQKRYLIYASNPNSLHLCCIPLYWKSLMLKMHTLMRKNLLTIGLYLLKNDLGQMAFIR